MLLLHLAAWFVLSCDVPPAPDAPAPSPPPQDPPAPDPAVTFAARCALCHKIGDRGYTFGPELSDSGLRLTREQLVESIDDPSKSIRAGYEYVELSLADGRKQYGILAPESAGMVLLRQPGGIVLRFPKSDVVKRVVLPISGMTLFTEKIPPADQSALVDWLLEQKVAVAVEDVPPPSFERKRGVPTWFIVGGGALTALLAAFAFRTLKRRG